MYIVAVANAYTFRDVVENDPVLKKYINDTVKNEHDLKICAFGAGPGTELLGISKYFDENYQGSGIGISFLLLDKVEEWTNSWFGIREEINNYLKATYGKKSDWPLIPTGDFLRCDVTQLDRLEHFSNIWMQNLFVCNFLISEIFKDNPGFRNFMTQIASNAPIGAHFLFIERKGPMWKNMIKQIAHEAGLELSEFKESAGSFLKEENPSDLGAIYEVISASRKPRTKRDIIYAVAIKV